MPFCLLDNPFCLLTRSIYSAGAAGNFLASIEQLSINAFKTVMDIDIMGSYNTLKATLPYLVESGGNHRVDSETRTCFLPDHISLASHTDSIK
jgi:hypothetical protein